MSRPPITTLTAPRRRLLSAFRRLSRKCEAPGLIALAREQGQAVPTTQYGLTILARLGYIERVPKPGRGYRMTKKEQE